ncbi:hypothetical protein BCR34DRAFT_113852 [Clohesyomyces aquaticus]|uniref:Uncharacterized protein n=1 Tax=Clohesyomyces aquaticus TaxID=1231657 RepID=A0A1Y1YQT8_9PLEO|nr:hypothetical protein BCR34DRAFT_113852 [Clohesyomyces aquaticus]
MARATSGRAGVRHADAIFESRCVACATVPCMFVFVRALIETMGWSRPISLRAASVVRYSVYSVGYTGFQRIPRHPARGKRRCGDPKLIHVNYAQVSRRGLDCTSWTEMSRSCNVLSEEGKLGLMIRYYRTEWGTAKRHGATIGHREDSAEGVEKAPQLPAQVRTVRTVHTYACRSDCERSRGWETPSRFRRPLPFSLCKSYRREQRD